MADKDQASSVGERERFLLMSAVRHGAPPGGEIRANCARVLLQALRWAGLWNEQLDHDLRSDTSNAVVDDWYRTLIAMTRSRDESLIEGQGNLGRPASPNYTGCRLTAKGRAFAERLFKMHPECRV